MPLDMTKLNALAAEWDPTPFLQAIEQAETMPAAGGAPGGAMDMTGSANVPGGDFASIMGAAPQAPGAAPLSPQMMKGLMPQQPKPGAAPAPAVAPQAPRQLNIQAPALPRIGKIPSLKDILGGY
jgi:hypothetical protein